MGYIDVFTGYLATTYCGYYAPYDIQNICQVFICVTRLDSLSTALVGVTIYTTMHNLLCRSVDD